MTRPSATQVGALAAALCLWGGAGAARAQVRSDDPAIHEYALHNASGMTVRFLNLGAIITQVDVPDREGRVANVVLGYGSAGEYRDRNVKNRFGAVVGRYAGRIANARFPLDGRAVRLQPNDGSNALHGGGAPGLDSRLWSVRRFRDGTADAATLTLVSPDGDQGFPGRLTVRVTYRLTRDALRIDYAARTTRATVLNLTNHSYFNLGGVGSGSVAGERLSITASRWVETDAAGIPTGRFPPVAGTPLDFRSPHPIGERIDAKAPMMGERGGYNHAWLLSAAARRRPAPAALLRDPATGRTLRIDTDQPSLQVYTGDYIDGRDVDAGGHPILPRGGVALETQHLPDSPNRPRFPTTTLRPGRLFRSTTIWRFGVDRGPDAR